jgi:hypothetical protein
VPEPDLARIALGWVGPGIVGASQLNGSGASAPTRPHQSSITVPNRAPGSQHSPFWQAPLCTRTLVLTGHSDAYRSFGGCRLSSDACRFSFSGLS